MTSSSDKLFQRKLDQVRNTTLFDAEWYQGTYPDVAQTALSPAEHFLRYGSALGRDPGPDFSTRLYAYRFGAEMAPDTVPLLHLLDRGGAPAGSQGAVPPMSDLKKKFRSGFSAQARRGLGAVFADDTARSDRRAEAALAIARAEMLANRWTEAVAWIDRAAACDAEAVVESGTELLLIESLINAGDFDRAQALISEKLATGPLEGNLAAAQSNLYRCRGGAEAQTARVAILNRLFSDHGLSPIALEDPGQGLVFGNIAFSSPEVPVEGPKVSVLIPVYNAGAFIDVAMQSLLTQTWTNLEIVAVEDRGTDDSWERLQAYAARDKRVRVFRNDQNMGAYPTRNRALHLSTGDFVTVHDSDDWSHPEMIARQMEGLLAPDGPKATCSVMVRVQPDMHFIQRPQRHNPEYVHRSYPSLLMRRSDLDLLGEWDAVSANADSELMHRIRALWGEEALVDVVPEVPLSFFLVHENSLTQQAGTNLNSLDFGIRKEYNRQASYWRKTRLDISQGKAVVQRTGMKVPFPIPQSLAPRHWPRDFNYDIVLISDLTQKKELLDINRNYLAAATALGLRVGLFNWPRADGPLREMADPYVELSYQDNIDILVPQDRVRCDLALVHHPAILLEPIDGTPEIEAGAVTVLADALCTERWNSAPSPGFVRGVARRCRALFGQEPDWVAATPRVRSLLGLVQPDAAPAKVWYPPLTDEMPAAPKMPDGVGTERAVVIGHHGHDVWARWPRRGEDILMTHCADRPGIRTEILGRIGEGVRKKLRREVPQNWTLHAPESLSPAGFLARIDVFIGYGNDDFISVYEIEALEAMAAGRVAVLPPHMEDTFGAAALYAAPDGVEATVRRLWADPDAYRAQAQRGFSFARAEACQSQVRARLSQHLSRARSSAAS